MLCSLLFLAVSGGCQTELSIEEVLLYSFSSTPASSEPLPKKEEKITSIRLPIEDGKSINPFLTSSANNRTLSTLLYDSLYRLSPHYEPEKLLAESFSMTDADCTVRIRKDAVFWDGTSLTAEDVAASLQYAQSFPNRFPLLKEVESVNIVDPYTLQLHLRERDVNAENLLTFPVVKKDTQEQDLPVGSGRYQPVEDLLLRRNPRALLTGSGSIETIALIPVSDQESLGYMLKIGSIDFFYDESAEHEYYSFGSSTPVSENRLTFLGIHTDGLGGKEQVSALLSNLNFQQIVAYACGDLAEAAPSLLQPQFYRIHQTDQSPQFPPQPANPPDLEGMSVRILVNEESSYRCNAAQIVADQLQEAGAEVQIQEKPYEEYLKAVEAKQFELYIGEVQIGDNMDVSFLFERENSRIMGLDYQEELYLQSLQLKRGELGYNAFLESFAQAQVLQPLLYRKGILGFSRSFSADIQVSEQDIFYNIQNW